MKLTSLQLFYLVMALVGLCATWYFNLQPNDLGFIPGMYANPASSSISNDLMVVVTAFLVWAFVETRRLKMSYWWWGTCLVLTFLIAAACMLPLFLFSRERRLAALGEPK